MSTNVTIMAHPKRTIHAEMLAATLEARIIWDRGQGEWDTGARALGNAYDRSIDGWACVIQDDALPIPNLRQHLEDAIEHAPKRTCIGLYVGTSRPLAHRVTVATDRATRQQVAWLTHTTLLWGVGILIPTETIPTILTTPSALPYDRRIGSHFDQVLYTWPSLVDHADIPSLLHNRGVERRAHRTGIPQWGTTTVGI